MIVNRGSNTLSVIEVTKNEIARTISLKDASFPHHASLDPDRAFLALAISGMDLSGGYSGNSEKMHGMMKGPLMRRITMRFFLPMPRKSGLPNDHGGKGDRA